MSSDQLPLDEVMVRPATGVRVLDPIAGPDGIVFVPLLPVVLLTSRVYAEWALVALSRVVLGSCGERGLAPRTLDKALPPRVSCTLARRTGPGSERR